MTTPTASVSGSPQAIARSFVDDYYRIMNSSPDKVSCFYEDPSAVSRPDSNGNWVSVTTIQAIKEKIAESMDVEKQQHWEIETVEAQLSDMNALFVVVDGFVTQTGPAVRFTQSFFLAPQDSDRRYFILNDVLSFYKFSLQDIPAVFEGTHLQDAGRLVDFYFWLLNNSSEEIQYMFHDSSVVTRREPNGYSISVTTEQGIKEEMELLLSRNDKWLRNAIVPQHSYMNGYFVVVGGFVRERSMIIRKFQQSFYFASPRTGQYFICNHVLIVTDPVRLEPTVQTPFLKKSWSLIQQLLTSLGTNKSEKEDRKQEEEEEAKDTNNSTLEIGGSSGIGVSHHQGELRRRGKKTEPCYI